jgi:hypothetical protein
MRDVRSLALFRLAAIAAVTDTARAPRHSSCHTGVNVSKSSPTRTVSAKSPPPSAGPAVRAAATALLTMLIVDKRVLPGVFSRT